MRLEHYLGIFPPVALKPKSAQNGMTWEQMLQNHYVDSALSMGEKEREEKRSPTSFGRWTEQKPTHLASRRSRSSTPRRSAPSLRRRGALGQDVSTNLAELDAHLDRHTCTTDSPTLSELQSVGVDNKVLMEAVELFEEDGVSQNSWVPRDQRIVETRVPGENHALGSALCDALLNKGGKGKEPTDEEKELVNILNKGTTGHSSLMKVTKWLVKTSGNEKVLQYLDQSGEAVTKTAVKWVARGLMLFYMVRAWIGIKTWLSPLYRSLSFNLPVVSTLLAVVPKKWASVIKQLGLPYMKAINLIIEQSNSKGAFWAEVHRKYGGWKSCWTLNWLKNIECVRKANACRLSKIWLGPTLTLGLMLWVETWTEDLKVSITSRSLPVYDELLHHLKTWALHSSRTPETLAMLRSTAVAWMAKNEDKVEFLTHDEKYMVIVAAVTNAMIPGVSEASAVDAMLGQSGRLRKMFNLNKRGWSNPIAGLLGKRLPTR